MCCSINPVLDNSAKKKKKKIPVLDFLILNKEAVS